MRTSIHGLGTTSKALIRISATTVMALWCLTTSHLKAELIGFYPFDDSQNPLKDQSGKGNDLQGVQADPTYAATGGVQGGAYVFNGGQRLVTPININYDILPTLTMGAWVKTSSLSSGLRKVIGQDDGGWDRVIGLDNREDGVFRYTSFIGTGAPLNGGLPGPVSTNNWTFLAATYDEGTATVTVYVDLDSATVGDPLVTASSPTVFGFGLDNTSIGSIRADNNSEGWEGAIDNVFFYDTVLSAEQLTAIRDGGKTAILGGAGDDPNLKVTSSPDLQALPKLPSIHAFAYNLENGGTTKALNISRVSISGPDAAYYAVSQFPATLAPKAKGKLDLTLDSKGQVGTYTAVVSVESNDPSDPTITLDVSARVVAPTLVGFYTFDDAQNPLKDDSGNGNTLQNGFEGGASNPNYLASGGLVGGAFEFAGSQRLVAPININPTAIPLLTMGAWVKTSTLEPGLHKVLGHDDGAWDRVIGLDTRAEALGGPLPNDTFRYAAFTGENNFGPTQGDPVPAPTSMDAWTFLAAVYDQPSKQLTFYVDLDATTTGDAPQAIVSATSMGTGQATTSIGSISPSGNGEAWIGLIDNAFFLSGKLEAATIKAIRDSGKQALAQFGADPTLIPPTGLLFGDLPNGAPKTISLEIKNGGATQPLRISSGRITGKDAGYYTLGTLPETVAPGDKAVIQITFNPQGHEGFFEGKFELISNNSVDRHTVLDLQANVAYTTLAHALIGFYPFDDAGNPLKDASGKGNDLTTVEGFVPTYQAAGGFSGGAYEFDGSQRLIAPIDINPTKIARLTMGAWVKTASVDPGLRKVIGHDDGAWDRVIGLDERSEVAGGSLPAGTLRYMAFTGLNAFGPTQGDPPPTPTSTEDWTFLAVTYDQPANLLTLFVDLDAKSTGDSLYVLTSVTDMGTSFNTTTSIGSIRPDNATEGWVGLIDNAFFYATVLSQDELTKIRNGGAAAILPPPSIQITGAAMKDGGFTVTWTSSAGKTYFVEYSESLPGQWTRIGTPASQGDATSFKDTDAGRLGKRTGYYRVALQP